MWIQVRTMDGKKNERIDGLSKLTAVDELRKLITEKFDIPPTSQRLFFRGKQMENGYTLFDYDVGLNAIVQLVERKSLSTEATSKPKVYDNASSSSDVDSGFDSVELISQEVKEEPEEASNVKKTPRSGTYQIGDLVDVLDTHIGAWFEAKIVNICPKSPTDENGSNDKSSATAPSTVLYAITFDEYDSEQKRVPGDEIRPRARRLLEWNKISIGDKVMANYNLDKPCERGFWYDSIVMQKKMKRNNIKELIVKVLLGPEKSVESCRVVFVEEIFAIEKVGQESGPVNGDVKRKTETDPDCTHCHDNPRRKCKECGCHVCGEKKDFDKTLLCDECDLPFHTFCLNPPLESLPDEDDWYCPLCRRDRGEVVNAGEKLKESKKKSKMKSFTSDSNRDWGKGMACVGRSKICTIVPSNHVGPIPGVPVGSLWKFRVQVSETGVHRPHVSGIHGKASEGAFSIVLAGGYEDDEDNGDEFTYTGSGGRDLSGNKRTAEQSCDQVLTKSNLAIAKTCKAKVDLKKGGEASNWQESRPIRVVRNYKGAKHSEYAPEEGNRYDGLYKVVKYWPEKGKSGFVVWRFLFRRDDPEPAPWTQAGKKHSRKLGITMQYPDGFLENQAKKESTADKTTKRKREGASPGASPSKKVKVTSYAIPASIKKLIKEDEENKKIWEESLQSAEEGQQTFFETLQDVFTCVCCQDVVHQPITTPCNHNICKTCVQRSFKAEVHSCPVCRTELGVDYQMEINKTLQTILLHFLPGYGNGR